MVSTINEHTASMTEALFRAANSHFIDPAFLKKLIAVNAHWEAVAVHINMYREMNEEHATAQLQIRATVHVSAAGKWFTYLDKIMSMELHEQQSVDA